MQNSASKKPIHLFLLGFITLFLELVLIRYLSGNIWNLGYFPNLVLLGVFIGMGVGFIFHSIIPDSKSAFYFTMGTLVLFALILFVTFVHPPVPGFFGPSGEFGGDLYFTIAPSRPTAVSQALFVLWFLPIIICFALFSQYTAKIFRQFEPLHAYTLDISGSCAGIITFILISFFQIPAYFWFLFVGFLMVLILANSDTNKRIPYTATSAIALILCSLFAYYQDTQLLATHNSHVTISSGVETRWSPYQKIEYIDAPRLERRIHVNGIGHQQMEDENYIKTRFYQIPYAKRAETLVKNPSIGTFKNVLVLGAGSGNDVAAALLNGADHVDAVEIDPVIAELGKEYHTVKPYADPRVTVHIDDGRAFMQRTKTQYDLIIFALTDSLVKVSPMAQLRLENYLFTKDSVQKAFQLLSPNGEILFYNYYRREWLIGKLEQMMIHATGRFPIKIHHEGDFAMFTVRKFDPTPSATEVSARLLAAGEVQMPTDDWPFLYLKNKGIPDTYVKAMAAIGILVLMLAGLLQWYQSKSKTTDKCSFEIKTAFVFMGIAFLLLETKSIIQFSLLFGTTWLNNSLVFLSVLLSVLAANWAAVQLKLKNIGVIAVILIASCLVTLVLPLSELLKVESVGWRFILASLLTFSPIFFANLIFSISFRKQKFSEHVFGWNLLGATLGGVIEYVSMAIGYNALAIVVAFCYLIVIWMLTKEKRLERLKH